MSIVYMGKSTAKEGHSDELRKFILEIIVPAVRGSEGNLACQAMQRQDDPNTFFIIETWESVEAHRASIKNISRESIDTYMQLVAGPPEGGYYQNI